MQKLQTLALTAIISALTLSGCGNSNWHAHHENAEKALSGNDVNKLQVAENEFMKAIEVAWEDRVPEKEVVPTYERIGDVFMAEHKYKDAQKYFLRTVQFGNALHTTAEQNIAQLRKLTASYEKNRDYEQAYQTQNVLVHLIEFEKSPLAPEYKMESAKNLELKAKLDKYMAPIANETREKAPPEEPPTAAFEAAKAAANLLTGWH